jgi:hypothetical protein
MLFHILHFGLSQDIKYSSLCYTIGPCLSILYMKTSHLLTPASYSIASPVSSPLATPVCPVCLFHMFIWKHTFWSDIVCSGAPLIEHLRSRLSQMNWDCVGIHISQLPFVPSPTSPKLEDEYQPATRKEGTWWNKSSQSGCCVGRVVLF